MREQLTVALAVVASVVALSGCMLFSGPPSPAEMATEVAALQEKVLPVVRELRVSWYLNDDLRCGAIEWARGKFHSAGASCGRDDGSQVFDDQTTAAFRQLTDAIAASRVPTDRLYEAVFASDGRVQSAVFRRAGGGIDYVFKYIYSPTAKPAEWTSPLGPVVLTKIGDTGWWFERSPND
jgi:hypothetical protein